jgi:hypothetical protein
MSEYERNQEAAERICRELRWNGRGFKLGDYIVLLDGNVVAVTDGAGDALLALRSIDPDPSRGMIVEVAPSVVDVIR